MKKTFIKKILIFSTTTSLLPILGLNNLTSCTKKETSDNIKSIDGSDWKGHTQGTLTFENYLIDDAEKTVTYNSIINYASKDNLVIPDYVKYNNQKYKVLLGPRCFLDNSEIKGTVELNKFTTEIPFQCFASIEKFMNITKIIFNEYPTKIGNEAFYGCRLLKSIVVKNNNVYDSMWTRKLESIGDLAFYECDLSSDQPSGGDLCFFQPLKYLGIQSFYKTRLGYVSLALANQLTTIPEAAFSECTLLLNVEFGPSITTIGKRAFDACNFLKEIFLPKDGMIFEISELSFANCSAFEKFSRVCYFKEFPKSCFANCSSLQTQLWMDGPTKEWHPQIRESAFENCCFRTIKFRTNTLQPEPRSFGSYGGSSKVADGIIIDFTECDLTPELVPVPPSWVSLVRPDPKDPDFETKVLKNAIFTDKPSCGRLRFKGTGTTVLSGDWDEVFWSLGIVDSDIGENKWKIEFVE